MLKLKKIFIVFMMTLLVVDHSIVMDVRISEAKATKEAMKFLKGTWMLNGESGSIKVVFTRKYMKKYSLWKEFGISTYSPKHKGKFIDEVKIVSTKKKNGKWTIKVGEKGEYTWYKGKGDSLDCWFKSESGDWCYSGSSSLTRVRET